MKILAVDYGTKRLGLAWADTTLGVVLPYGTITDSKKQNKEDQLIALARAERIDQLVLGFPMSLTGRENAMTSRVQQLAFELQKQLGIPVQFFDERFTSAAADRRGGQATRDEQAAMIILEGYLEKRK